MSEHVLKIPVSELLTVRVICQVKDCTGVVEVALDRLGRVAVCPVCGERLVPQEGHDMNILRDLANGLRNLDRIKRQASVEFIIPQPEKD